MVPLPFPLAPEVIWTQPLVFTTDHEHPVVAATPNVLLSIPDPWARLVGTSE